MRRILRLVRRGLRRLLRGFRIRLKKRVSRERNIADGLFVIYDAQDLLQLLLPATRMIDEISI